MEKKVYGIDLGTTYSAIATLDHNSMPKVIENYNDGGNLLASAVYFPEGGDPVIGSVSKTQSEIEPDRVVQYVKREIGKPNPQIYEFDGVKYDPIAVSTLILKRMKEYAEEQGEEVKDVVITCPAYFDDPERIATKQAGEMAGLNVLNIVNEPTAAALNYCSREFKESRKIMVYDLGGGTFDITLFDFAVDDNGQASIEVIKTGGNDRLGGIDWDNRLYEYFCELYADEHGLSETDMDAELRQILRNSAEDSKKKLTNMQTWNFTVSYAGDSTRMSITRETFEDLTKDLVEKTLDFVRSLLSDVGISDSGDVNTVLLVGGSTKMPMINAAVKDLFPKSDVRVEHPDLAVAQGAALAAAIKYNEKKKEFTEKVEEILNQGGDVEEINALADEYETVAPEIFESIEKGSASLAEIREAVEEVADSEINIPNSISVSDQLKSSKGLRIWDEAKDALVIDNLLFAEDRAPSEVTKMYQTMGERPIKLMVYNNTSIDRFSGSLLPQRTDFYDIEDEDARDKAFEDAFDVALSVKYLGSVPLPIGMPAGTPIEVTFKFDTDGLTVRAKNCNTNETVEMKLEGGETFMGSEELEQAKARFATIKTSGQI